MRIYKARRLIPREPIPPDGTTIGQSERLDSVARRALGDPERFWRLCDANRAMNPFDLHENTGHVLAVPEF